MKLYDLIEELTKIASESPEADVKFQTIEMGQVWFPTKSATFIDARWKDGSCIITIGPHESIAVDYKRVADEQDQQKK
jgi:hypothetical protein